MLGLIQMCNISSKVVKPGDEASTCSIDAFFDYTIQMFPRTPHSSQDLTFV